MGITFASLYYPTVSSGRGYVRVSPEAEHAPADVLGAHVDMQQVAQEGFLDDVLDAATSQDGHDVLHRDQRLAERFDTLTVALLPNITYILRKYLLK